MGSVLNCIHYRLSPRETVTVEISYNDRLLYLLYEPVNKKLSCGGLYTDVMVHFPISIVIISILFTLVDAADVTISVGNINENSTAVFFEWYFRCEVHSCDAG